MILTRQKQIPWLWVFLITTTAAVVTYVEILNGQALAFTLRKFTKDPALITFIGSINIAFNFLVAPFSSWKSDQIWTRLGRRKPFMIVGFILVALALLLVPLAPNIWILACVIIVWQFGLDLGYVGTWGPLLYEIVPMHQRGRMVVIKRLLGTLMRLAFNAALIGQFDRQYDVHLGWFSLHYTGEQVVYYLGSALVVAAILHLLFNVRELRPDQPTPTHRFTVARYLRDIFPNRQFLLVYLLMFCNVMLGARLAQLGPLLITEQFHYTKAVMGQNDSIIILVDLILIMPLTALVIDRFDRFRLFQVGLFLSTIEPLLYWFFIKFIAVDQIPSRPQLIGYSILHIIPSHIALLSLEPLFFDLVRRDQMGALNSGFLFVKNILSLIVVNVLGLWVKYYSEFFNHGHTDYTSGFLYLSFVGTLGCIGTIYFDRQRRAGKIIYYGKIEEEQSKLRAHRFMNKSSHVSVENPTTDQPVVQRLHPDALYDDLYQEVSLDTSSYRPTMGTATVVNSTRNSITFAAGNRQLRVESPGEGILRLRYGQRGQEIAPSTTERLGLVDLSGMAPRELQHRRMRNQWRIATDHLRLNLQPASWDLSLTDAKGAPLWETVQGGIRFDDEPGEYSGQRFFCRSVLQPDEYIYGFGGRIAPPDRTGSTADMFSVKTGKVSGDYGGFPVPFFLSTRGYGFFLNNPWPHVYFDLGRTHRERWFVHAPGGDCDVFLLAGPTFADIVRRYTAITGRTPVVPRWLLGFWCSSLTFNNAAQALKDAARLRAEDYPCDVFVFDGPWRGGKDFAAMYQQKQEYPSNDLEWHPDFGDGPPMIRRLADLGVHTSLHLNSRNFRPETAREGIAAGLLRQHGDEVVPRLLNIQAEEYYESLLAPRIQDGVDLWWTDHSDRLSGEIEPGLPSRNLFGPLWNRLLARAMARAGRPQDLSLSRGGGIGSQKYAIPWPGDTRCGMDALADDIWFMVNAGLAGFTLSSADLGGFVPRGNPQKDYPSQEAVLAEMFDDDNIARRVCHCLFFTPVPRIHNNWSTTAKFPWNCGEKIRPLYRAALRERYRLTPYIYSHVLAASRTGEPLLRPLAYHHPDDPEALAAQTQFYLGDALLIAPVTEAKTKRWPVYLPRGQWTHLWSGQSFEGSQRIEIDAPLYKLSGLPVFVRKGAILVRQEPTASLGNEIPSVLDIDIYPDGQSAFDLHEAPEQTSRVTATVRDRTTVVAFQNATALPRICRIHVHDPRDANRVSHGEITVAPGAAGEITLGLDGSMS